MLSLASRVCFKSANRKNMYCTFMEIYSEVSLMSFYAIFPSILLSKICVLKYTDTDSIKVPTFYEARLQYSEFMLIKKAETQC